MQGDGVLGSYLPYPWGIPEEELLRIPGCRQPKDQDIAEAKKLLSEAGYTTCFRTEILTRLQPERVGCAVFAKDQLHRIGIKASVRIEEPGSYVEHLPAEL